MKCNAFAIFNSVHQVLKAEKILKEAGIPVDTVPVPRKISSDCGVAISFPPEFAKRVRTALSNTPAPPAALYRKNPDNSFTKI